MASVECEVESGEGLERRLKVTLPWKDIENAIDARVAEMRSTVSIPGFRPGKVSDRVIKERFRPAVREEVAKKLMEKHTQEQIQAHQLTPLTKPKVHALANIESHQPWSFEVMFEIEPEIQLVDPASFSYDKINVLISDEEIDVQLDRLREQHAQWETVDRPVQKNDKITIAFEGTVDGERFEGSYSEDFSLRVGQGEIWSDLERQLLGLSVQDQDYLLEAEVPPESGLGSEWIGKKALFKLKILKISVPILPEWNVDFVKTLGISTGELSDLRKKILEWMLAQQDELIGQLYKKDIMDFLDGHHTLILPQSIVEAEWDQLKQTKQSWMRPVSEDSELSEEESLQLRKEAEKRVELGLLIHRYSKEYALEASEDELYELVQKEAGRYRDPQKTLAWFYQEPMRLAHFVTVILEKKVVDYVLSKGTSQTVTVTTSELMSRLS